MFAKIEHLDQVKEAIVGKDEFFISDKGDHFISNYQVNFVDTFENPFEDGISEKESFKRKLRRECRGIIFDKNGNIIRRPYNKFFNYGEKQDELNHFAFDQNHYVLEKLDGSMIAPYRIDNKLVYGTKMGSTDVSNLAEQFVDGKDNYYHFSNECIGNGYTPIFEFVSRKQRIIVDYPEDNLILTAIRDMYNGEYATYDQMVDIANRRNIPYVKKYDNVSDFEQFLESVKTDEEKEGYVIRWENGFMGKFKADLYLKLHRTMDGLRSEKGAIQLILENRMDDALPLLDDYIKNGLLQFADDITGHLLQTAKYIYEIVNSNKHLTKKEFATGVVMNNPELKKFSMIIFCAFDFKQTVEEIYDALVKQALFVSGNTTRLDENRHLFDNKRWENYI